MSDDGGWMNEEEDDVEVQNENQDSQESVKMEKVKRKPPVQGEKPVEEKSEAILLIEQKKKQAEEEEQEKIRQVEETLREQREKEDAELKILKEKQAQRKKEREMEDAKFEEQKRLLEEKRRQEEEARKQKAEEDKRRKQEADERRKAAQVVAQTGGRNFVIEKKADSGETTIDKFLNISKAKAEMSLNTGELETLKRRTIDERVKPLALEELDYEGLKAKAEELWKAIVLLETSRYDLTERSTRQEYDLKQLNERQRQTHAKKSTAAGEAAENGRFPPKVLLFSKYERRTDRRTFQERKAIFDEENRKADDEPKGPKPKVDVLGWKVKPLDDEEEGGQEEQGNQENQEENQENEEPSRNDENDYSQQNGHQEETAVEAGGDEEEESIW